ncbi:MAG TPA: isoprenylcysteine carboxylmethyltransferase family protein [Gemmatimonadaceae bacterium]|nr:isoprenylcysteine carboxylmethyltransferase family protein [Gemmatimonadaceae bacterium]
MNAKTRSLLATLALVVCIVLLFVRHALIAANPIGLALQVLAALLMLWARLTFGMRSFHATANPTAGGLVTTGPYRYWRHPIYAAVLLFTWTGILAHGAPPMLTDLALGALATVMTLVRVLAEEQLLRVAIPEYAGYAARTKRFIPFVL